MMSLKEEISELQYENYKRKVGHVDNIIIINNGIEKTIRQYKQMQINAMFNEDDLIIHSYRMENFYRLSSMIEGYGHKDMRQGSSVVVTGVVASKLSEILVLARVTTQGPDVIIVSGSKRISLNQILKKLIALNTEPDSDFNITDTLKCKYRVTRNGVNTLHVLCFLG